MIYTKENLDYQDFLMKVHEWYLDGNTAILFDYLREIFNKFPKNHLEDLVIKAIKDDYFEIIVNWICPNFDFIFKEDKSLPKEEKSYTCNECDSSFLGNSISTSIEIRFKEEKFNRKEFDA